MNANAVLMDCFSYIYDSNLFDLSLLSLLFLFILAGLVGRAIVLAIFDSFVPKDEGYKTDTYIDNSVHHHYHDYRTVNMDGKSFKRNKISSDSDEFTS